MDSESEVGLHSLTDSISKSSSFGSSEAPAHLKELFNDKCFTILSLSLRKSDLERPAELDY